MNKKNIYIYLKREKTRKVASSLEYWRIVIHYEKNTKKIMADANNEGVGKQMGKKKYKRDEGALEAWNVRLWRAKMSLDALNFVM